MTDQTAVAQRVVDSHRDRERGLHRRVGATGCRLHRSRREEGRYMVYDLKHDGIAAGDAFELTLDDVEAWIKAREHPDQNP